MIDAFEREIKKGDMILYSVSGTVYVGIIIKTTAKSFDIECTTASQDWVRWNGNEGLGPMHCKNPALAVKITRDILTPRLRKLFNTKSRILTNLKK
jgi:hypothetical protein